jgi:hypothetical protein
LTRGTSSQERGHVETRQPFLSGILFREVPAA